VDGGYTLVFGTEVDKSGTVVDTRYVTRETDKVILDLREYDVGQTLVYFEDTSAGMGYYVASNGSQEEFRVGDLDDLTLISDMLTTIGFNQHDYTSDANTVFGQFMDGEQMIMPGRTPTNNVSSDIYNSATGEYLLPYPQYQKAVGTLGWGVGVLGGITGTFTEDTTLEIYYGSGTFDRSSLDLKSDIFTPSCILKDGVVIDRTWNWTDWNGGISPDDNAWTAAEKIDQIQRKVTLNVNSGETIKIGDYISNYVGICNLYAIKKDSIVYYTGVNDDYFYLYTVTVSNGVFYLNEVQNPQLTLTPGKNYIFDQSDPLNTGNQLILGTVPDLSSSMISYQTVVGTPGQPGAYTSFTATEETVFYFSYETPDMGYEP